MLRISHCDLIWCNCFYGIIRRFTQFFFDDFSTYFLSFSPISRCRLNCADTRHFCKNLMFFNYLFIFGFIFRWCVTASAVLFTLAHNAFPFPFFSVVCASSSVFSSPFWYVVRRVFILIFVSVSVRWKPPPSSHTERHTHCQFVSSYTQKYSSTRLTHANEIYAFSTDLTELQFEIGARAKTVERSVATISLT